MMMVMSSKLLICAFVLLQCVSCKTSPLVINTWEFSHATQAAWDSLQSGGSRLDAIVEGCSQCEYIYRSCDASVGTGGSPDESGETTLDAMLMDGPTHDVGAVGCLRDIQSAIGVARAVMEYTKHTLLVGQLATDFALEMGFEPFNLSSSDSIRDWENWKNRNCQPNYRQNVMPDPTQSCGPYSPNPTSEKSSQDQKYKAVKGNKLKQKVDKLRDQNQAFPSKNLELLQSIGRDPTEGHDTIAMLVIDSDGNLAVGTSTNGAGYKVPGRVGDSPIAGAGAYVDNEVGGAGATGDGDIMMRFLPSLRVVEMMRGGMDPESAIKNMLDIIEQSYPGFAGAMVAVNKNGEYGAACIGFAWFKYNVVTAATGEVEVVDVDCPTP